MTRKPKEGLVGRSMSGLWNSNSEYPSSPLKKRLEMMKKSSSRLVFVLSRYLMEYLCAIAATESGYLKKKKTFHF